jgi:cytochrome c553
MNKLALPFLILVACVSATTAIAAESVAPNEAPPIKVITSCQRCHGPSGDSVSETVPRLNGQQEAYIVERLNNFLDPTREDPHATKSMWGVVSKIDNATFASLAAYYSRQTPTKPAGSGALADEGRKIYMNGASLQQVPACTGCHGPHAEGGRSIPRLAGQHADYLKKQLDRLSLAIRESSVMHPSLYRITDHQIKALVAYLANK